jgi:hypothetical protein
MIPIEADILTLRSMDTWIRYRCVDTGQIVRVVPCCEHEDYGLLRRKRRLVRRSFLVSDLGQIHWKAVTEHDFAKRYEQVPGTIQ